jgi:hypothetical protein
MNNPGVVEVPKGGLVRWLVITGVCMLALCCVVGFMLPFALDDAQYLSKSIHLSRNGVTVPGVVAEVEESDTNDSGNEQTFYRLTVEYTVNGTTYSVRNQEFISNYYVGDTIDVIYDPADPANAQVDIFSERWLDPILEMLPF